MSKIAYEIFNQNIAIQSIFCIFNVKLIFMIDNIDALLNRISKMMQGAENRRSLASVYDDLNEITSDYKIIYSLSYIMCKDMRGSIDKIYLGDTYERLSIKELQFVIRLWLKNSNKNIGEDILKEEVSTKSLLIRKLLDELHAAVYVDPSILIDAAKSGISYKEIMNRPESFREAFFYSSEPAYEEQFLRFASQKYIYDKDWLQANSIDIDDLYVFYKRVHALLQNKGRTLSTILNPTPEDFLSSWCFTSEEIALSFKGLSHFFDLLSISFNSGVNDDFNDIGDFNCLQEKPIIKLPDGNYFVSSIYGLSEAIYYSPYYWMMQDEGYCKQAIYNRGKSAENITYELLSKIVGQYSIYKDVIIKSSKSKNVTDVDILLISRNIAIVFQVKSKILTVLSRKGDLDAIKSDYNKAIKSSYNQGLKCKECLLDPNRYTFDISSIGLKQIHAIHDVYCVSILLEGYPGIIFQSQIIEKEDASVFPIAISIFDLELIIKYLSNVEKFIDYIKKRELYASQMIAENEIVLLKRYLDTGFESIEEENGFLYDNSLAQELDFAYHIEKLTNTFSKKVQRNDPCPCGSGLKYKQCHGKYN